MAELYGMQPLRRLELSNLSLVSDRVTTLTTLGMQKQSGGWMMNDDVIICEANIK